MTNGVRDGRLVIAGERHEIQEFRAAAVALVAVGGLMLFRSALLDMRPFRTGLAVTLLGLMVTLSLLPIGLAQAWASVEHGLWFARSAEFLQQPWLQTLRWLRMPGDSLFLIGVAAFTWFMAETIDVTM